MGFNRVNDLEKFHKSAGHQFQNSTKISYNYYIQVHSVYILIINNGVAAIML